jgi:hypothetical protein
MAILQEERWLLMPELYSDLIITRRLNHEAICCHLGQSLYGQVQISML